MKTKHFKRPYLAILHRTEPGRKSTTILWTRYFKRLDTGIPRAVQLAMLEGQPGDIVEFASANHGYQIATIKLTVNAKLAALDIRFSRDLLEA